MPPWGPADGVVDPHGLTVAYLELARAHGADIRFRHAVTSLDLGRGEWVVRAGPEEFAAGLVVNAAGGWAGQVAALAGLDVPVSHSRRQHLRWRAGRVGPAAADDDRPGQRRLPAQ